MTIVNSKRDVIKKQVEDVLKSEITAGVFRYMSKFEIRDIDKDAKLKLKQALSKISGNSLSGNIFDNVHVTYLDKDMYFDVTDAKKAARGDKFTLEISDIAKKEVLSFPDMDLTTTVANGAAPDGSTSLISSGDIILTRKNVQHRVIDKKFDSKTSSAVSVSGDSGAKFKVGSIRINNSNVEIKDGDSLVDIVKLINISCVNVRAIIEQGVDLKYNITLIPAVAGSELVLEDQDSILGSITNTMPSVTIKLIPGDSIMTVIAKAV